MHLNLFLKYTEHIIVVIDNYCNIHIMDIRRSFAQNPFHMQYIHRQYSYPTNKMHPLPILTSFLNFEKHFFRANRTVANVLNKIKFGKIT